MEFISEIEPHCSGMFLWMTLIELFLSPAYPPPGLTCSCGTSWWPCWSSGWAGRPAPQWSWGRGRASVGRPSSEPPSPPGPAPLEASSAAARGSGNPGCNPAPPGSCPRSGCRSRSSVASSCKLQTQGKCALKAESQNERGSAGPVSSCSVTAQSSVHQQWLHQCKKGFCLIFLILVFAKSVFIFEQSNVLGSKKVVGLIRRVEGCCQSLNVTLQQTAGSSWVTLPLHGERQLGLAPATLQPWVRLGEKIDWRYTDGWVGGWYPCCWRVWQWTKQPDELSCWKKHFKCIKCSFQLGYNAALNCKTAKQTVWKYVSLSLSTCSFYFYSKKYLLSCLFVFFYCSFFLCFSNVLILYWQCIDNVLIHFLKKEL